MMAEAAITTPPSTVLNRLTSTALINSTISNNQVRLAVQAAHPHLTSTLTYLHHFGYASAADLVLADSRLYGSVDTASRQLKQLQNLRMAASAPRADVFQPFLYHTTRHGRTFLRNAQNAFDVPETRHQAIAPQQLHHERDITRVLITLLHWIRQRDDVTLKKLERNFHRPC